MPEGTARAVEVVSVAAGLIYALLAVRRSRWCWLFGSVSSAGLAWLAFGARLPMQAALQLLYVGLAAYGFWRWSSDRDEDGVRIGWWPVRLHLMGLAGVALLALVTARALAGIDSASPLLDAATTWASLLATWLAARGRIENWLYWIVIDVALVVLFTRSDLEGVAGLYAAYLVIAAAGFVAWRKRLAAPAPA
jgi:nicotinamide mononucleotide transporter